MNTRKILVTSIILNIAQILLIIVTIGLARYDVDYGRGIIFGLVCLSIANMIITAVSYIRLQKTQYQNLVSSMKDLEQLNLTLRAQRHDYLNQMQVVYGLLDMEEFEEAKDYMDSVFKEITKVSRALKTAEPAINALLQAKLQMAEKESIDLYLDIRTDLKNLMIEPWELCKVLANIIDNAITVLKKQDGEKKIHITIKQNQSSYSFIITNNGPKIEEAELRLIFNQGYTTKKETGHGMGLYIVQNIIKEANGILELVSDEKQTCFTVNLPKKE